MSDGSESVKSLDETERKQKIKKGKRKIKLRRYKDFLIPMALYEMIISICGIIPMMLGMLPDTRECAIRVAVIAYLIYAILAFFAFVRIYFKERVARLYFKTGIAAYVSFAVFGLLMAKFWKNGAILLFMPMRALRTAGRSNFVSFAVGYSLLFVIFVLAYLYCLLRTKPKKF